jgi:hypothetical protein
MLLSQVCRLPDSQSPVWLGLPANAEMVLLAARAKQMVISVMKLQVRELQMHIDLVLLFLSPSVLTHHLSDHRRGEGEGQ